MLKIFYLIILFLFFSCGKQVNQNKPIQVKPSNICVEPFELNDYNDYDPSYDELNHENDPYYD